MPEIPEVQALKDQVLKADDLMDRAAAHIAGEPTRQKTAIDAAVAAALLEQGVSVTNATTDLQTHSAALDAALPKP